MHVFLHNIIPSVDDKTFLTNAPITGSRFSSNMLPPILKCLIWVHSLSLFFFFWTFYFILVYSKLTMLWSFQVNSKGTQSYIYIYPLFLMWVHSCLACTNRQCLFTQLRNKIYQEFHKLAVIYLCYPVWSCCFIVTPWKYLFTLLTLYFYPAALFPNLSVNCNFSFPYWSFGWSFWNISNSS